MTTNRVFAQQA